MNLKVGLAVVGLSLSIATAHASSVTDTFAFTDAQNVTTATGSFTYDTATVTTNVLSFADLSAFSISVFGQPYDLAFVQQLALENNNSAAENYVYFGFDRAAGNFVPSSISGYAQPFSGILAATDGSVGFFIASLPGQADPAGTGSDGATTAYAQPSIEGFSVTAYVNGVAVAAVPELSTWVMLLLGFCGIGCLSYYRSIPIFPKAGGTYVG
jgi:hypothetical protein